MRAHHVHIYLRRHAEWFPGEQTRAARKAGPNRAAFGRTANVQLSTYTHSSTAVTSAAEGSTVYQHRHYKPTLLVLLRYL
jgi:hypothetical protein